MIDWWGFIRCKLSVADFCTWRCMGWLGRALKKLQPWSQWHFNVITAFWRPSTHPFVLWVGSLKELSRVGLHGSLSPTAGHLQLGHLRNVLPVGIPILGLLFVCQLADVIGGFLRVEAGHAWGAMICDLTGWEKVQRSSNYRVWAQGCDDLNWHLNTIAIKCCSYKSA